ncbi:MAG: type II secretion system protein N [Betaproteobacteria bacterium]
MQATPNIRARPVPNIFTALATSAALLLLCAVMAYWTWAWLAPDTAVITPEAAAPQTTDAAKQLFGGSAQNPLPATASGPVVRLTGVAAAGSGESYAVLQIDAGRAITVREGADIMPGIRLLQVMPSGIAIERHGRRETIALPEKK